MPDPTFRVRLRSLRERAGLTVPQLAERAGLQRTHLYALEGGRKASPSWDVVCRLAAALQVSTDEFRSVPPSDGGSP